MVEKEKEHYEHDLYKYTEDKKNADAVAYAFLNKEKMIFFPYKQPHLDADEIRANVLYAGLCLSDSKHGRAKWGGSLYPLAPGHEIIAEVSEVGTEVKDFKKGDKVAFGTMRHCCGKCRYCLEGKEPLCTETGTKRKEKFTYNYQWGGYSTQLQQPASFFFKLPKNLKIEKAAPLLCAGITVYAPIKKYAKKGMKTAVIGIGGLGHLALQFLHKMGYEVDAITTSKDKEKFIKELGADRVINSTDPSELAKVQGSYDLIINTSPTSKNFEEMLLLTARSGFFIQVGAPSIDEKVSFIVNTLILNEIVLTGSVVGSRDAVREMLEFCSEKDIYPIVEEFPFEEFPKAFDKLENGKPIFRCVVDCGKYSKANGLFK